MAGRFPDHDALVSVERGVSYTYRGINEVVGCSKGLLRMGCQEGDTFPYANNVPEWVILQFATAKIGAVLVTINTSYKVGRAGIYPRAVRFQHAGSWSSPSRVRLSGNTLFSFPRVKGCRSGYAFRVKTPMSQERGLHWEEIPAGMFNFSVLAKMGTEVSDSELAEVEQSLAVMR